jgi:hypothetical protein
VVELASLTSIVRQAGNSVEVLAQGADSRVELPALTHFCAVEGSAGSFLQAEDGGVLLLNDTLTTLFGDVDLRLTETGVVQIGALESTSRASLSGTGALTASLTNTDVVRPSSAGAPGQIVIQGDYHQGVEGRLAAELGGAAPGAGYGQLAGQGRAAISGSLEVSQLADFAPVAGSTFEVLTSAGLSRTFGTVTQIAYEPRGPHENGVFGVGEVGATLHLSEVRLTWQAVEAAADYQLYRALPGETDPGEYQRTGNKTELTDTTPEDGLYRYAIASVRQANGQEALSAPSAPPPSRSMQTRPRLTPPRTSR